MPSIKAMIGNKCMSNKTFVKSLKQGQSLTITDVSAKSNQYGGDDVLGIQFKEKQGCLRLNTSNAMSLAEVYGDDTDKWQNKKCIVTWRPGEMDGKVTTEVILTANK